MKWVSRFPVPLWTVAWGATGLTLKIAGVFDDTLDGPRWVAFLVGTLSWTLAGATTVTTIGAEPTWRRIGVGALVWGGAFVWLASFAVPLGAWIRQTQFGSMYPAGFVGLLIAWSVAAALAAALTTRLVQRQAGLMRPLAMGVRWGFSFFFGGYLGVPLASILGESCEAIFGTHVAFQVGWTIACMLAGWMAIAAALSIGRSRNPDVRHNRRASDRMGQAAGGPGPAPAPPSVRPAIDRRA